MKPQPIRLVRIQGTTLHFSNGRSVTVSLQLAATLRVGSLFDTEVGIWIPLSKDIARVVYLR